jgi:hypothetical protein
MKRSENAKIFEDGLDSWARYPCSLSKDSKKEHLVFTEKS